MRNQMEFLKLKFEIESEGWVCPYCGVVYKRPKECKPKIGYCMKCKGEWKK